MASDQDKGLLYRTILIIAFPYLKLFYTIFDGLCFIFQQLCRCIGRLLGQIYKLLIAFIKLAAGALEKLGFGPAIKYQELRSPRREPLPYENEYLRRFFTHSGGLLLGVALYIFVYIVLVKHHSVHSISVAFILMLPYLLVLENSHSIRAIMMLCLPIMFTNRGRALIFCCMLAIMASGPLKNSQLNINELHKSLNCSKQYLILRTDEYAEKNVVRKLMRAEEVIKTLIEDIKLFGQEIRQKVQHIVQLALIVDKYIRLAVEELKKIVNICNSHSQEYIDNCKRNANSAYLDCKRSLNLLSAFCELVRPAGRSYCDAINWPAKFCEISKRVIEYVEKGLEERLVAIIQAIENMLYVEIDISHSYSFNGTKSKSFRKVISEIKFDVERKFWYIHFVVRVFNLVTLILVIWITLTATLYHMHYLDEISYDNMYLDKRLIDIDDHRKRRIKSNKATKNKKAPDTREPSYSIFPMTKQHEQQYLWPFGVWMNEMEHHKLLIAGLVWLIIVSYIGFFVILDFGLYHLIELINQILNDILFKSDLPIIDVTSKSGTQVVHYNRSHLSQLRQRANRSTASNKSKVGEIYRRLMDSVERNIPDDVMILDSLQECLPRSSEPNYKSYRSIVYLAAVTFGGVILEAYALRLRHWIADLYYPRRANKRSMWLYRKILSEKPKYEQNARAPELLAAEMLGRAIKR